MGDIFMKSDTKTGSSSTVSIREIRSAIGDIASRQILVVHAIGGCDTTSAIYGHSKVSVWKKLTKNKAAARLCAVINNSNANHDEIELAGCHLMSIIYNGKETDSLNLLRFKTYMNLLSTGTRQPQPERLPPTESATKFHIYRVHLQVIQWATLMDCNLKPEDWGWKVSYGRYIPVATDIAVAPDDVLKIVRCPRA